MFARIELNPIQLRNKLAKKTHQLKKLQTISENRR